MKKGNCCCSLVAEFVSWLQVPGSLLYAVFLVHIGKLSFIRHASQRCEWMQPSANSRMVLEQSSTGYEQIGYWLFGGELQASCPSHRSQSRIENVDHEISIRFSDAQRRFDSKRVPVEAAF